MNWISIHSLAEWESLLEENKISRDRTIAVFKHSTRCPISSMAKTRLESDWQEHNSEVPIYYLDLITHRDISNAIEKSTNVVHESPQILLLKGGEVIYHASHIAINSKAVANCK